MATHIIATNRPIYWAGDSAGAVIHAGMIETTGAVGTPLTLISDPDEIAYLGKVAGKGGDYKPLPDSGSLIAGEIYGYGDGLVIVRQSHERTIYPPEQTPALFAVYREGGRLLDWIANEPVLVGMRRRYDGTDYECLQSHTTQADWTPPSLPALWREVQAADTWAVGVAYKVGDRVTYQGNLYECRQAHTSQAGWTPPAVPALWLAL